MITPQNFWLWFGGIWLSVGSLFLVIGISVVLQRITVKDRLEKEDRSTQGVVLTKEVYPISHVEQERLAVQSLLSHHVSVCAAPRRDRARNCRCH